jgi:L-Ala-D/L-Glu epimerase
MSTHRVRSLTARKVVRPLRTTFATALGSKASLTSFIVTVTLENGLTGTGEIPTSYAVRHEDPAAIQGLIRALRPQIIGLPLEDYEAVITFLRSRYPSFPMTISGLDVALFRAWLAVGGRGEHAYWGGRLKVLETDITVPFAPDREAVTGWIEKALTKDFKVFKVKLSGREADDLELLDTVWSVLSCAGRSTAVRLDGNQGFDLSGCLSLISHMEKRGYAVEAIEQPLRKDDFHGLKELRKRTPCPLIVDETVFTASDMARAVEEELCDGVNIKTAKSGIIESRRIMEAALAANLRCMAGCMIETMTGLSAGIYLAAGTGSFDFIDLDAPHFLYGKKDLEGITLRGPCYLIG